MKKYFTDILSLAGVQGALFLTADGDVQIAEFTESASAPAKDLDWKALTTAIHRLREIDMLYEKHRIYIRRSDSGHLVVVADPSVSGAMLRLNCDIVLPALKQTGSKGALKRFFKKSAH